MSNDIDDVDFSLLDGSVDELADLKAFAPLPAGSYKLLIGWERKAINNMPAVILKLENREVLELANANDVPPEVGAKSDIAMILKTKEGKRNEMGEGQLKQVVSVLQEVFPGANIAEVMAQSEGAEILATLKVRTNKDDPDQKYNQIKKVEMPV